MKNLLKFKAIIAFIAVTSLTISCDNDDDVATVPVEPKKDNSITGIAQSSPNLSVLVQALAKADLATTLQGVGPYTVFAPTDAAFTAFLKTTPYATLNDVPKNVLAQILLNHVVSGAVKSTSLSTGYVKTLAKGTASAENTLSMFVDVTSGVKLNGGAMVATADIIAANGVIHIVNKVITLPTVVDHALANPNFTSLVGALTGAGQPNYVAVLSGTGPFTVMAPTNAAFTALNTELAPGGTAGVSTANLTKVLNYHVANGNVLAASLKEGQKVATLQAPQTYEIQLTDGAKIKDNAGRTTNIVATDVQCSNGVIHVVSKVLLPTL